jgi:hypothetical protein
MAAPALIGSIGARLDLTVRAGDTLGPFTAELKDSAGVAINLTGATFTAALSKLDSNDGELPMTVGISGDPLLGIVTYSYVAASTLTLDGGTDFFTSQSNYAWKLRMTDSAGTESTLLYGKIKVAPKDLP